MKRVAVIIIAVLLVAPVVTEGADWKARLRVINIAPNDSSSTILDTGTEVTVDSKATVEVDITMMLSESWGLELIAATAAHDLATSGGDLGGVNAGEVKVLPPTLTLQYFFATDGGWHPYVGAGVNFTLFYDYDLSDALAGVGATDVDFDESFGFAGDIGVDIDLNDKWLFNLDLKYIMIDTDATIEVAGGGSLDTVSVDIDPWVYGIGIGVRF